MRCGARAQLSARSSPPENGLVMCSNADRKKKNGFDAGGADIQRVATGHFSDAMSYLESGQVKAGEMPTHIIRKTDIDRARSKNIQPKNLAVKGSLPRLNSTLFFDIVTPVLMK